MTGYDVIVVGGGPVGLTLAIDLGQRGVRCLLVDKRPAPLFLPKMERCHNRTMEIFRRLGIAEEIRKAGWPQDQALDDFLVTDLQSEPLVRWPHPSVEQLRAEHESVRDGTAPAEPYQVISQYTLEPLLKSIAERTPGVSVRFGCEVTGYDEWPGSVSVHLLGLDGRQETVEAAYVAGCDGAASTVRQVLGARLAGDSDVGVQYQALFYSPDLWEKIPSIMRGCHYHVTDGRWTFMIVQDDLRHFTLHSRVDDEEEMPAVFEQLVGTPITYETLFVGKWTMRLMLADRYSSERVFLAGDAVHLVTPVGGLGMNTGIGDATDLAWKMAATIKGWGGPELLRSYQAERRQVGERNVSCSRRAYEARKVWRALLNEEGDSDRTRLKDVAFAQQSQGSANIEGIIRGYRYLRSPVVSYDPGDTGEDQSSFDYLPLALPGGRLPNVWLDDGTPVQDRLRPDRFTLLACMPVTSGLAGLRAAFADASCPLDVLDLSASSSCRDVYGPQILLVRPDLHIAWRGETAPEDPVAVTALVTGRTER